MGKKTLLKRVSAMTGCENEMVINADKESIEDWIENRYQRPLIQKVFPDLTTQEREFIMTGITPAEWDSVSIEEEEEGGAV